MSHLSTTLDINHIRRLETELFQLIDQQVKDKIESIPFNSERAKRIDDLQNTYSKYCVYQ